jgi:hypothetical protein
MLFQAYNDVINGKECVKKEAHLDYSDFFLERDYV